jgi:tRNA-2-methylthio-N6-dimethylallyladenosine synthase
MNRKYTREQFINLIKKIRLEKPEIAIGTDIIVGFCSESKKQFEQTVDLYKQCNFDIAYLAMYSERSGTVAAKIYKDDVSMEEKKRRWRVLQDLMEEIVLRKNQKYLGQVVEVLVDEFKDGVCTGNSNEMKLMQFLGNKKMVGKLVKVKINFAEKWILKGEAC